MNSDDLWLLLFMVLFVIIAMVMAAGFVIAVAVGGYIVVQYIRFLIRLWQEGKKGWFWIGVIVVVIPTFLVAGYYVYEIQKSDSCNAAKKQYELTMESPGSLNLVFDHKEEINAAGETSTRYFFRIESSQVLTELSERYKERCSCFFETLVILSPGMWTFDDQPYSQFTQKNSVWREFASTSFEFQKQNQGDEICTWSSTCELLLPGYGCSSNPREYGQAIYKPSVTIKGPGASGLKKICFRICLADYDGSYHYGVEKSICSNCR